VFVDGSDIAFYMSLLFLEVSADRIRKLLARNPVRGPRRDRLKTPADLVFALGARFEDLLAVLNAVW
jgi:hypothetical protein